MLCCVIKPVVFYKAVIENIDIIPASNEDQQTHYLDVDYLDRNSLGCSELGTLPQEALKKLISKF